MPGCMWKEYCPSSTPVVIQHLKLEKNIFAWARQSLPGIGVYTPMTEMSLRQCGRAQNVTVPPGDPIVFDVKYRLPSTITDNPGMNMSTARIVKRCCYFDLVAKIWKTDGVVTEVNNETEDMHMTCKTTRLREHGPGAFAVSIYVSTAPQLLLGSDKGGVVKLQMPEFTHPAAMLITAVLAAVGLVSAFLVLRAYLKDRSPKYTDVDRVHILVNRKPKKTAKVASFVPEPDDDEPRPPPDLKTASRVSLFVRGLPTHPLREMMRPSVTHVHKTRAVIVVWAVLCHLGVNLLILDSTTERCMDSEPPAHPNPTYHCLKAQTKLQSDLLGKNWVMIREEQPNMIPLLEQLGWSEKAWQDSSEPDAYGRDWIDLSLEERTAARAIGYREDIWRRCKITDCAGRFRQLDQYWRTEAQWATMHSPDRDAWLSLGWNQSSWWGMEEPPPQEIWSELSDTQRDAAVLLGYSQDTWDICKPTDEEINYVPPNPCKYVEMETGPRVLVFGLVSALAGFFSG